MFPYPLDLPLSAPFDRTLWEPRHHVAFVAVTQIGLVMLEGICNLPSLLPSVKQIPMSGKPLMKLELKDWACIIFNRLSVAVFAQQAALWAWNESRVRWTLSEADVLNTGLALPLLYLVYDFFYTIWHRLLHVRAIYPYIHKVRDTGVASTQGRRIDQVSRPRSSSS